MSLRLSQRRSAVTNFRSSPASMPTSSRRGVVAPTALTRGASGEVKEGSLNYALPNSHNCGSARLAKQDERAAEMRGSGGDHLPQKKLS